MSLKEKRIRSINWDEEEKELFRSVFKKFATQIENKSLDNNANKLKTKAWEEVHKKFNEINSRLRSLNQLKSQWKAMKIKARKEVSQFKKENKKTGGGGRPQTPTNEIMEINDLLNPAELLRDENIYDSDGIMISASTSKDLSGSETCIFTSQDMIENMVQSDLAVSDNIAGKQEADSMSVVTVVEDHIPATSQETIAPLILQTDNAAEKAKIKKIEVITPKNIYKLKKKLKKTSKSPCCSTKRNNYVDTMVNHSKILKQEEHQKRMEILEVELNIQKEKLKSAILEREILEIRKSKEL